MALRIQSSARTMTPTPWDLSNVPHASDESFACTSETLQDIAASVIRSISLAEGVDSRNHVLAARILYGSDSAQALMGVAPYTVAISSKHQTRWVLWVKDALPEDVLTRQQDGFKVSIGGLAPRGPFFLDAVLVPYGIKQRDTAFVSANISAEQAEAAMDQPLVAKWSRQMDKMVHMHWVSGIPKELAVPIHHYKVHTSQQQQPAMSATATCMAPASCDHCGKVHQQQKSLRRCALCKAAWYCDKDCQTAAWKAGHKQACVAK